MMPLRYSSQVRAKVLELSDEGCSMKKLAAEFGIAETTIYLWRAQARIARGEKPGVTSTETAKSMALKFRVAELEKELTATKRARFP